MNKIALTQNEFNLLLRENHPEFDSCTSRNNWIEDGSGCDRVFEREVIRHSDSKTFVVSFIHNNSLEDYQDWIHDSDCDFYIDDLKKDIYDSRGNIKVEKNIKENIVDSKEKTILDIYHEMEGNGEIDIYESDNWFNIDSNDFVELVEKVNRVFDKSDSYEILDFRNDTYQCAVKNKINSNRIFAETFKNQKLRGISKERIRTFIDGKKSLFNSEKIDVVIQGVTISISKANFNNILKQGKDLEEFHMKINGK